MVAPAALRRFRHNVIVICVPKYGDDLGDAGYGQEFGRECEYGLWLCDGHGAGLGMNIGMIKSVHM